MTTLTGDYVTLDDGRPAVRLTRTYARPVARVWQYASDPAELAHWFPSRFEVAELRPGARIRFFDDPNMPESTGTVLAADAPHHLAYSWGGDELRLDVTPLDDGTTRLTLTNVLASADTAARNAAGWEVCLSALDRADRGGSGPAGPEWKEVYDAYVLAEFPSGAPIPGTDDLS
ncbi:SRPBCC family protein [Streptomyces sp. VRA16 Mangrove soil]|uniref:SRPBCC family protein n=1 Tax=Streptomyces sp. VRA16 Mangrove soil TaxID=2817434 RepID=UPI001A9DBC54|nr:SRPBCC family protein [Streptomyces sp. VRA16 Mangrove soil]MBO1330584.1 SRPBCC family protein [Streptomyces sp. VRA16 Mangrove soil]